MTLGNEIYIPNFRKNGIGFQAILRFGLWNLRECNDGVTDERDYKVRS
jgi:hypothetical protein